MINAVEKLERLRALSAVAILSSDSTYMLRDLAFTYGGRDLPYAQMVPHLIEKITPLAIAERLKS